MCEDLQKSTCISVPTSKPKGIVNITKFTLVDGVGTCTLLCIVMVFLTPENHHESDIYIF